MSIHLPPLITQWREREGITQQQAAKRIGISQSFLSRMESGERFPERATAQLLIGAGVITAEQYAAAMVNAPASQAA
ncbi:helix-turn-helix transcriptional regulator [Sandarakinorhabdus sp.]|uniref:helix-turn-helix domain-containing protein n=1 Tax=Sandarakinorhabdus sp. TaxID=1916663 RepID=UPI00286E55F8|nr:helix-turn-helix transcriptional regulator [Sandarakinorhabdus sp.]